LVVCTNFISEALGDPGDPWTPPAPSYSNDDHGYRQRSGNDVTVGMYTVRKRGSVRARGQLRRISSAVDGSSVARRILSLPLPVKLGKRPVVSTCRPHTANILDDSVTLTF